MLNNMGKHILAFFLKKKRGREGKREKERK
jgi:hypothetical protein